MSSQEVGTLRTRLSWEDEGTTRGLKGFKDDLRGLRSEMNAARSNGREYSNSLRGLREQSDILTRRLSVQKREVTELRRRYEESRRVKGENAQQTKNLSNQYNNAIAAMNRTEQQLGRVTNQINQQIDPWRRLGQSADEMGKKMETIGRGMTSFGRSWSLRVTAPILGAGAAALKVGMDFEQGMSKVQALTGATGQTMESLSEQAKELGATTRFTATQAADAMGFLGMAGWEAQEIMAGMPGLLSLAASASMDLGRAADITSNIMSGFNIAAAESGRVSDILAHAASSANTDVEQLGEAMKYVAPMANALGISIEDATAAMMGVADAGLQGSMGGRAFATSLTRLASPTAAMEKEMKRLNLSFFDSEGAMKPLPDIIQGIEKATSDMNEQTKATTLSTLFGAEAQKHWAVLLEQGSKNIRNNTKELENSEGAAQRMADTMSDNAKGAIIEFRSALEGIGITLSEHMIPVFTDMVKQATDLVRRFGDLDEESQKQIIKWALVAAAIGPVSIGLGGMVTTMGGLLRVVGFVSGAISGAGGLAAVLTALTGPVGLTVAAIGALSYGVYRYVDAQREAREVSIESAKSMLEQADAVEVNVARYDELHRKSRLTSDEMGRLLDIQTDLNSAQDPDRVARLQEQYDLLREKSGLTNEELSEMLGLNDEIIGQSPMVEQSFTNKGNAVITATDAVHDYIQSLRDMALEELQVERLQALENEAQMLKDNNKLREELVVIERTFSELLDYRNMKEDEANARLDELNEKRRNGLLTQQEMSEVEHEIWFLERVINDEVSDQLSNLQKQREEIAGKLAQNEEELAKLYQIDEAISGILLKELDINEAGKEGLTVADENLAKLREQKAEIEEQIRREGDKGNVLQDQITYLDRQIAQHESVIQRIERETRLASDLVRETERYESQVRHVNDVLSAQERQLQGNNRVVDEGTGKARELTDELGKDVRKEVDVDDRGTAARIQEEAERSATKRVTLSAVWSNVTSGLTAALANFRIPGFASGTNFAPGGPALVGEEGFELARHGNRWSMLDFGITNLPRGTQVFTHDESKDILRALNQIPAFATGASPAGEAQRVIDQLNNRQVNLSSNRLSNALSGVHTNGSEPIVIEVPIYLDGRPIAKATAPYMDEEMANMKRRTNRSRGRG